MDGHRRHDATSGPGGAPSRRAVLRGIGGAGLAALFATRWASAAAQDATPVAMAGHPVVGAWRWTNNPGTEHEFFSFAIFVADGTYVETGEDSFVIVGEWRATGEQTAELVIIPGQKVPLDAL